METSGCWRWQDDEVGVFRGKHRYRMDLAKKKAMCAKGNRTGEVGMVLSGASGAGYGAIEFAVCPAGFQSCLVQSFLVYLHIVF